MPLRVWNNSNKPHGFTWRRESAEARASLAIYIELQKTNCTLISGREFAFLLCAMIYAIWCFCFPLGLIHSIYYPDLS